MPQKIAEAEQRQKDLIDVLATAWNLR